MSIEEVKELSARGMDPDGRYAILGYHGAIAVGRYFRRDASGSRAAEDRLRADIRDLARWVGLSPIPPRDLWGIRSTLVVSSRREEAGEVFDAVIAELYHRMLATVRALDTPPDRVN